MFCFTAGTESLHCFGRGNIFTDSLKIFFMFRPRKALLHSSVLFSCVRCKSGPLLPWLMVLGRCWGQLEKGSSLLGTWYMWAPAPSPTARGACTILCLLSYGLVYFSLIVDGKEYHIVLGFYKQQKIKLNIISKPWKTNMNGCIHSNYKNNEFEMPNINQISNILLYKHL